MSASQKATGGAGGKSSDIEPTKLSKAARRRLNKARAKAEAKAKAFDPYPLATTRRNQLKSGRRDPTVPRDLSTRVSLEYNGPIPSNERTFEQRERAYRRSERSKKNKEEREALLISISRIVGRPLERGPPTESFGPSVLLTDSEALKLHKTLHRQAPIRTMGDAGLAMRIASRNPADRSTVAGMFEVSAKMASDKE